MATQQLAVIGDLDTLGIPASAFPASIDATAKNAALVAASSVVASYLKKRFTFPLVQWGVDVKTAVVAIAVYRLLSRRGFNPTSGTDAVVIRNYEDMIGSQGKLGWLDRVARGEVEPDDLIDGSPNVEEAAPLVDTISPHRWMLGVSDDEQF